MSFNGKTTLEKGGLDPPNVSLEYIVKDLISYFNEFKSLLDVKKEAEKKYGIKNENDNCWPVDDIKRAWGKTQRMGRTTFRRQHWALVVMLQVLNKEPAGNQQINSFSQTGGVSQSQTGTANTGQYQFPGNNPDESYRDGRTAAAIIHSHNTNPNETICIRIPYTLMFNNEEITGEPQTRNISPVYKLKDGFPGTRVNSEIRKKRSYVMSFNHQTRNANWVYELLNRNTIVNNPVRTTTFGDPYHRAHLAAAANHRWCREASNDADMIDNIVPQHQSLNTGPWLALEKKCRRIARDENIRNVHVYSGPLYLSEMNPQMIQDKWVPSHFFKVIIQEYENGTVELECHRTPNNEYVRTVTRADIRDIQRDSGLIFKEPRLDVGQNAVANQITVRLHGEDEDAVRRTAEMQITTFPFD